MLSTAEKFADLQNGLRELNVIQEADGRLPISVSQEAVMKRYMVGAQTLPDGREGFRFVDGSSTWRRQTDGRWETVRPVDVPE